ncbi:MAG TPA: hypothetical protein VKZ73_05135 [Microbacterium sp.]|nr:hypothetical protein [Microbacterium sp.]
MARPVLPPPVGPAEVAALPLHVVVRDYPETLAVLREAGVDVPGKGGARLADAAPDAGPLLDEILTATAWRARA